MHAVFTFTIETCETEASHTVETLNSPVFSRVIFEKSEMLSYFGSWIGVVSPSPEVIFSNSLGSYPVECVGSARCAFGSGTVRQGRCRRERGVDLTARKQQRRWMKHEKGEGEMERYDMRTANTLSHACARCLYATQGKRVRKCACDTECVYSRTHSSCHYVRNPETKKKIPSLRRSTCILISPTKTLSTNLLSTDHHQWKLLCFPRHALLLIFGDAFVWKLNLRFSLPRSAISNCERAIQASRACLGPDPRGICVVFLIQESDLLLCSCLR